MDAFMKEMFEMLLPTIKAIATENQATKKRASKRKRKGRTSGVQTADDADLDDDLEKPGDGSKAGGADDVAKPPPSPKSSVGSTHSTAENTAGAEDTSGGDDTPDNTGDGDAHEESAPPSGDEQGPLPGGKLPQSNDDNEDAEQETTSQTALAKRNRCKRRKRKQRKAKDGADGDVNAKSLESANAVAAGHKRRTPGDDTEGPVVKPKRAKASRNDEDKLPSATPAPLGKYHGTANYA